MSDDFFCEAALKLTETKEYHALNHMFLGCLEELPFVNLANIFEIYAESPTVTGEAKGVEEFAITRFPLLEKQQEDPHYIEVIEKSLKEEQMVIDTEGDFDLNALPIYSALGPTRVILTETALLEEDEVDTLKHISKLYSNLLGIIDSKERDALTRLFNRQTYDARIAELVRLATARLEHKTGTDKRSWLAICDIDHFKKINDTWGHLYGDEVLVVFSQLMTKYFRYSDLLFRHGGEEFVVILNNTNADGAQQALERFRQGVQERDFAVVGNVTVSIGYCEILPNTLPTTIVDRADIALYEAKNGGRNQVRAFVAREGEEIQKSGSVELF